MGIIRMRGEVLQCLHVILDRRTVNTQATRMKWRSIQMIEVANIRVRMWILIMVLVAASASSADQPSAESLGRSLISIWEGGNVDDLNAIRTVSFVRLLIIWTYSASSFNSAHG